jgi:hypothetical protein
MEPVSFCKTLNEVSASVGMKCADGGNTDKANADLARDSRIGERRPTRSELLAARKFGPPRVIWEPRYRRVALLPIIPLAGRSLK